MGQASRCKNRHVTHAMLVWQAAFGHLEDLPPWVLRERWEKLQVMLFGHADMLHPCHTQTFIRFFNPQLRRVRLKKREDVYSVARLDDFDWLLTCNFPYFIKFLGGENTLHRLTWAPLMPKAEAMFWGWKLKGRSSWHPKLGGCWWLWTWFTWTFNVVNQVRSEKTVFIARPVTFFHVISNSWVELKRNFSQKILNPAAELTPGTASSTCPVWGGGLLASGACFRVRYWAPGLWPRDLRCLSKSKDRHTYDVWDQNWTWIFDSTTWSFLVISLLTMVLGPYHEAWHHEIFAFVCFQSDGW